MRIAGHGLSVHVERVPCVPGPWKAWTVCVAGAGGNVSVADAALGSACMRIDRDNAADYLIAIAVGIGLVGTMVFLTLVVFLFIDH